MLKIKRPIFSAMVHHLQSAYPLEACGFLSGRRNLADRLHCIDNILQSPVAYEMDPTQQITAMIDMENRGEKMLVIFHSHPQGPQTPSETDIEQAFYPEAIYMIVSLENRRQPIANAYKIENGMVRKTTWQLV
ncbi:MAG: M67 family metallopeptidase [Anaerolineales bacterium]|nr:M67 family metallopeptidase [Anaerolineales bacterium]MCA9928146.1 M67 family metallopeptidase [Anaerolineales bacterium]